jgi:hypothetical protein
LPEIKNSDFISTSALYIDILYIIKDNANNINNIIRTLIINKSIDGPKFYYYKANELIYYKLTDTNYSTPPVTVDENITIAALKAELTNFITLIDPRLASSNLYLDSSIRKDEFDFFYSGSIIGIDVINIYDLMRSTNLYATYDVNNNRFIDYFNFTTQGGQELANISKILLDETGIKYKNKEELCNAIIMYLTNYKITYEQIKEIRDKNKEFEMKLINENK